MTKKILAIIILSSSLQKRHVDILPKSKHWERYTLQNPQTFSKSKYESDYSFVFELAVKGKGYLFVWHCAQNTTQALGTLDFYPGFDISFLGDLEVVTSPCKTSADACKWLSLAWSSLTSFPAFTFYEICQDLPWDLCDHATNY